MTAAPRSGVVAMMHAAPNGYTVEARAADTGKPRWFSAPWHPPTPVEGAQGDTESGRAGEIPDVLAIEQDGREYVLAYAHGMRGKDSLHEGAEVVRLAVYAADASGTSVKPLREIDVPVSAEPGEVWVGSTGGRILVAWGSDEAFPDSAAAVDVATGKVDAYEKPNGMLPQCATTVACASSRVMAATADGPLVGMGTGGFGIPGRWFSDAVRPGGVEAKTGIIGSWNGHAYGVAGGHVLAGWSTGGTFGAPNAPLWSVHDARTGRIKASMTCAHPVTDSNRARDYPVITSPDGRFLAAGPVVFDLKRGKGICLEGDGDRKTIALASIRDDGTAYGAAQDKSATDDTEPVAAQLNLTTDTGEPKVLDAGMTVPYLTGVNGSGLFLGHDDDGKVRVSLRRER
ncbi:hypothetical protein OHA84_16285 [Streptomyces sp. NBC_00513]|uniref:hypothetical protein n=1 Tax=unclassified Streptomyces TaxID=2593676 RepID=UPI0022522CC2|nr:hypothetical protein [Streptomyces sp. NBC_00424]MCX5074903.1 hypothetical protein [Streptomyces sp. NBC_00424]WUD41933.1 hypothetical protein OHA84_16285 [Streptomyces sp. NBC_00513]